ncbi:2-amino-4,5-dihydroxy-6-one-heptanoic acid-7-phosphate synthase [Kibdelosporangium aridum]|uniref:2-amino-4,5-dihydroxy-6-one-heptanoic acid-7-phosphate synthase n=1 Tax=Kibdelosporangium aridum TaxID=2030 RepID=A0A428YC66_KIBAR|nr:2-amino-3,7-dideoxy-D-threo-hept-6-ulosonate synthase [Kibdelosporangium aridum]RSM65256.1 2-amino-4,5-dihydroxy-6-one-heptanoic acid-7-phosphate synthase [Kibdelosporangium aridum]
MLLNGAFGRQMRLRRLYRHGDSRLLVVPLDHPVTEGPVTGGRRVDALVGELAGNGVDAVVLHKGSLRYVDHRWFARMALIVHLSASTVHAPDPDAKYLVGSVEEALRLGADAVSVHVNLGSRQEMRQIGDLALVSEACDRWNLPLLAMMYPRGPEMATPNTPELVSHAVALAADLGVDIVKTLYAGSVDEMADVTRDSPVPVLTAGGPLRCATDTESYVADVLRGGAAGVAMGRNVFQADDPGAMARRLSALIHGELEETTLGEFGDHLQLTAG